VLSGFIGGIFARVLCPVLEVEAEVPDLDSTELNAMVKQSQLKFNISTSFFRGQVPAHNHVRHPRRTFDNYIVHRMAE